MGRAWWYLIITVIMVVIIYLLVTRMKSRNFFSRVWGHTVTSPVKPLRVVEWRGREDNDLLTGVFSVSLFGTPNPDWSKRYFQPLLANCSKVPIGWRYRVYLDPLLTDYADQLVQAGAQVGIVNCSSQHYSGTVWRYLSAADSPAFICADADEPIKTAYHSDQVNYWLHQTQVPFYLSTLYLINLFIPISAGCWGGRAHCCPDIAQRLSRYDHSWFGADESFLTKEIWSILKKQGYYRSNRVIYVYLILLLCLILLWVLIWTSPLLYPPVE